MATKFYLPASGTSPLNSLAVAAGWAHNASGFARAPMSTTKGSTSIASRNGSFPDNNSDSMCTGQWVSPGITAAFAFTTSHTITAAVRCYEANAQVDAHLALIVRVVSNDGTTVRGTIYDKRSTGTEYSTTAGSRVINALALTGNVNAQMGDRIVVEVGTYGVTPNITYNWTQQFGESSATDLTTTEDVTAQNNPWVELSPTLNFVAQINTTQPTYGSITPSGDNVYTFDANYHTYTYDGGGAADLTDWQQSGNSLGGGATKNLYVSIYDNPSTVTATTQLKTYSFTVTQTTGGTISPSSGSQTWGSTPTYTFTPDANWENVQRIIDSANQGAGSSYQFSAVSAAHTVTASWQPIARTATVGFTARNAGFIATATNTPPAGSDRTIDSLPFTATKAGFVATATYAPPAYTASVGFTARNAGFVATSTYTAPQYSATVDFTSRKASFVATATYSVTEITASVGFTARKSGFVAASTYTDPQYSATVGFTSRAAGFVATAAYSVNEITATVGFTARASGFVATAAYSAPSNDRDATVGFTSRAAGFVATAAYSVTEITATVGFTARTAGLAVASTYTPPQYSATVGFTARTASLGVASTYTDPQYTASVGFTAKKAGFVATAAYSVPEVTAAVGFTARTAGFVATSTYAGPTYSATVGFTGRNSTIGVVADATGPQYTASVSFTARASGHRGTATYLAPQYDASVSFSGGNARVGVSGTYSDPAYTATVGFVARNAHIEVNQFFLSQGLMRTKQVAGARAAGALPYARESSAVMTELAPDAAKPSIARMEDS